MKVTREQVEQMRELIQPLDTEDTREKYRNGDFPRSELTKDLDRRYRWDLYWSAKAWRVIEDAEYNDEHINTALKFIVPGLGVKA